MLAEPGKYDTYKGSTLDIATISSHVIASGKYDTYKGSTLAVRFQRNHQHTEGNMILIKDCFTLPNTRNSILFLCLVFYFFLVNLLLSFDI